MMLSERAPLRDGIICTSELATLLYYAPDGSIKNPEAPHAIYPVMVIAASGYTVRITQAIWNVQQGKIQIRMGPVLSFPNGLWDKEDQYLSLLDWAISDPVGKTR